jgi:peptidoglycan glycosyltransferase
MDMREGRAYSNLEAIRASMVHWVGDRRGNINVPIFNHYAQALAGYDPLAGIYTYGNQLPVLEMTLSSQIQTAALEALGDYKGTIAVYNYKTGELLCAVSTPCFDPDNEPEITEENKQQLEGMYLNRFVQSVYIPGSIFKIVTLAAALETIPDIQQQKFVCYGSYQIGTEEITCEGAHWEQSLQDAFRNSCNCAFAQISQQLDPEALESYAKKFGLTGSISFDGFTTNTGNFEISDAAVLNVAWSSIGQYTDQINPCAFMTFVGSIAANGRGAQPYVVDSITIGDSETYKAETDFGDTLVSQQTAEIIRRYMRYNVETKYGDQNFPGLTVCAKTGTAEVGGDKRPNAMIAGFVEDEQYPLAFIIAVEDGGYGSTVCVPMLSQVLQACKAELDS